MIRRNKVKREEKALNRAIFIRNMLRSIRRNHSIFNAGRRNLSNQSNNALNKTSTPVKSTNRFGIFIAANLITSTGIIVYAANRITQDAEFDRYIHDSGIPFLDPFLHTIGKNLPSFLRFTTIKQSTPPSTTTPITSKKPRNPDNIPSSLPTPIITDTTPTTTPTTDSTTTLESKENKIVNEVENEEVIEEIISTEELFAAKGHNSKEHIHPTTTDHTTTDSTTANSNNKHIHEERLVSELYDTTHDNDDTTTTTTAAPNEEVETSLQPSTSLPQTTTVVAGSPETDPSQQVILPTTSELLFRKLQSESTLATTTPTTPTITPSQYTLTNIENMTTDQLRIQLIHLTYTLNEHIQRDNNRLYYNIKQIEYEYNNKYKDLLLLQRSELESELSKRLVIQEENNKVCIVYCI